MSETDGNRPGGEMAAHPDGTHQPHGSLARIALFYLAMLGMGVGVFLLIRAFGNTLTAPATEAVPGAAPPAGGKETALIHVLLTLATIIVAGRLVGRLFARLGQPPVIGEVLAGILLGPSLLGLLAPEVSAFLLPEATAPILGIIAQLGVILYMFLVGLEFNPRLLRDRGHATLAISHASILFPFVLGAALALVLYPRLSSAEVSFTAFALFLGVAMSVTAFPVLARILTDRGISRTGLGVVALTCAAVDDVTAWCLLALVVGVVKAEVGNALLVSAWSLGYVAFLFLLVRPYLKWLVRRAEGEGLSRDVLSVILACLLLSALATEWIGIHAIFGAFLLGVVIPHDSSVSRQLTLKLEDLVTTLLLPAFFAFTGMRTQIGLIAGWENILLCAAIIVVATAGKFGGTLLAARFTGFRWPQSAALGVLMNTRGLMELIVLNVGLELGVISPTLFAMMVLMALVTTIATTPLLNLLTPWLTADLQEPAATTQETRTPFEEAADSVRCEISTDTLPDALLLESPGEGRYPESSS